MISALIPTYNRRDKVMRAVDSVISQTVPVDEIIVVDDGSTDGTAEAIRQRYGSRVIVIQQKNAGVSVARNVGIRNSTGKWIAFLDSDDLWLPTKIQRQMEALDSLGDGFGACFTDCVYDGDPSLKQLSVFQQADFGNGSKSGSLDDPAAYMVAGREPFFLPSLMILRSVLNEANGFDESLVTGEDTELMFRLCFATKFCYVNDPLVRIDRTPRRPDALSDLFGDSRDDRKFDHLTGLYLRWLQMAEVVGTAHEDQIRNMLRLVYYDSAECKFHQLRVGLALREIKRLRSTGVGYPSISANLIRRKISRLRRNSESTLQAPVRQSAQ